MAIPLRALKALNPDSLPPRPSMDSEASAILSYALGKHPHAKDDADSDADDDSPRPSSEQSTARSSSRRTILSTSDYEPSLPRKQVTPPSLWKHSDEEKSRRFRICLILLLGVLFLVWIGALIGFLSKGIFCRIRRPQVLLLRVEGSRLIRYIPDGGRRSK